MNLLLIESEELRQDGTAQLTGRRHLHAREVLRAQEGDVLRVGLRGGSVGTAVVTGQTEKSLELKVTLDSPAPPRSGVTLILAVPRPKAVKRLLPAFASMGLDHVVLLNASRVEKSYFDARALEPATVSRLFDEGLEQGRDTVAPDLRIRERFKPFVEDELPGLTRGAAYCLLCHPGAPALPRREPHARTVLAVGPEGGWVDFELAMFEKAGFVKAGLGARPLRTEIAVPAALGALGLS
jgi:RsmE family RNA methyltransferase